jgi:hypothetical protein
MAERTDRDLLEQAAKAAGIEAAWRPNVAAGGEWLAVPMNDGCDSWTEWNPLIDDGDALRLAVRRELCVTVEPGFVSVIDDQGVEHVEHFNGDPCAAVRRAIVRATAAVRDEE